MDKIEAFQRAAAVAEARKWIGTPYHPCADILGAGVDCGMLIVRVFVDAGLVPAFDPRPYPPDWHLHRNEEKYLGFVFDRCHEIAMDQAAPGDVIVFRYGRCHAHGGVVTDLFPFSLVHAFSPARAVIEEPLARNATLSAAQRDPRCFSLWTQVAPNSTP